ncbi:MAG TPA: transglycosylase domain-containing protein [Acidimicrobiales bacterium]|nr:transglycosylase domain-containing protein [Acidimicrobiales bacterium]
MIFLGVFIAFTGLAAAAYIMIRVPLPTVDVPQQTTFLTDVGGSRLASLFAGEDRVNVKLSEVPDVVQQAVLAVEDRNFFRHSGIDPVGIMRAFVNDMRNRSSLQGGSTITQQYVKNTYVGSDRTVWRKIREAVLAIKVERKLNKREILERYLNTIYFGRGAYGVEAAARAYFGKDVGGLGLREASYLAGLIRAPQVADALRAPDVAKDRRHRSLVAMRRAGMITDADITDVDGTPMAGEDGYVIDQAKLEPRIVREQSTGYFVDYVVRQLERDYGNRVFGGGLIVKTTLDTKMQAAAYDTIYDSKTGVLNRPGDPAGALVAVDENGNVKAMVGGKDFKDQQVNLAVGRGGGGLGRQAGSTFKPFLLAEVVREGYTVESSFPAPPKLVLPKANNGKDWEVSNYEDKDFGDEVNLIDATKNSINTVYAQLVVTLGAAKLKSMAEQMGVTSPLPAVNSLVLGTAEVSPLEMASAFSTFGNRGERVPPRTILEVKAPDGSILYRAPAKPERKRVLTTKQVDVVNFVLRQVVEHGTGTGASFNKVGSLVGKTGTTDELGDAWFVGSTTKLSAAVWMGYPEGASHHMDDVHGLKVNGGTFPAMIFKRFMQSATRNLTLGSFPDVTDFPGNVLKGERIPYDRTTTTTGSSTTRPGTTSTLPEGPTPTDFPTWQTTPPRPTRTVPDEGPSTTRRKKKN